MILVALVLPSGLSSASTSGSEVSPASAATDWKATIEQQIADSEYEVTWQDTTSLPDLEASWQAPNRAQGLRTYFTPTGVHVIPRVAKPSWEWSASLRRWGRRGSTPEALPSTQMRVAKNRVTYDRGALTEELTNGRRGLEHTFAIPHRPSAPGGFVQLDLALGGALSPAIAAGGQAIQFATAQGVWVMRYADLRVTDARGQKLRCWMEGIWEAGLRGFRIAFDDADAVYPLTIESLLTSPAWTAESDQANALFGTSVATAGDVNGDGYADFIVGAPDYDNGQLNEGRAFVYYGSVAGPAAIPAWTAESNQAESDFGRSVGTAGDVNHDGYADVVVGAPMYDNGQTDEGRAFVYHGSAAGLGTTPAWTAESDQASAGFGQSVTAAGDVNADGYADVIVGAPDYDNGQSNEGRAFGYYGSIAGLAASPAWTAESNQVESDFGRSVGTAGDVNHDGYADVVVGAPMYDNGQTDEGRAFVYHGSAAGLAPSPAWTAESNQSGANFAQSVATAGDVNADGYADVIVGCPAYNNIESDEGRAFVYLGSAAGLGTSPAWTTEIDQDNARFGQSVATAGDVNGDGYADVIVGAPGFGQFGVGEVFVYHGAAGGPGMSPAWTLVGTQSNADFGGSVATAGDVNGDGYSDVILGAANHGNGQAKEGRAYVFQGSAAGLSSSPGWTAVGEQTQAGFGVSVASAGDVNGDGFGDVIVGADKYDNGQTDEGRAFVYHGSALGVAPIPAWTAEGDQPGAFFGRSVGAAGDVNGDGYGDVIVGAFMYTHDQTNEGRAFVYHGSAAGLAGSPAWTAEGNHAQDWFGYSVATAGDVNGDGYADVIVGAYGYDNGQTDEGGTFVYHGSAAGLAADPAWAAEGNQANDRFGYSVSTAGDVNGDGYDDVIVGAYLYDNNQADEGVAFVYLGSAAGLAVNSAWSLERDRAQANFGYSVATAGDANHDGYADVIVGSPGATIGEVAEGGAYLYRGSATGPAVLVWSDRGEQAGAFFGTSVATAGDVNRDGYDDIVVGAPGYLNDAGDGAAFVYYGSATGPAVHASWIALSDQPQAQFGSSVATAGDVNGDGFDDVIVGSCLYDGGQQDEGRAEIYFGNRARVDPLFCADRPDGTACDDGQLCTLTSVCSGGSCVGDIPVVCPASDQCHDAGVCLPDTGACSNPRKANGTACSDANLCTQTDTCQNGSCSGSNPIVCAASNPCHTVGVCDPGTGVCSNPPTTDGTACSDGSACTQHDTCQAGACQPGSPVVCAPATACRLAGVCDPVMGCSNPNAPDGTSCVDGNACTQTDVCSNGICQGTNPTLCAPSDTCHQAGTCAPATGICSNPTAPNGAACDDGNVCTASDHCTAGSCAGTPQVPAELTNARFADKVTFVWDAASASSSYDVLRGAIGSLPVGPGGGDEDCFDDQATATLTDTDTPTTDAGFWYVVRAANACGQGNYGTQRDLTPRASTTCP